MKAQLNNMAKNGSDFPEELKDFPWKNIWGTLKVIKYKIRSATVKLTTWTLSWVPSFLFSNFIRRSQYCEKHNIISVKMIQRHVNLVHNGAQLAECRRKGKPLMSKQNASAPNLELSFPAFYSELVIEPL